MKTSTLLGHPDLKAVLRPTRPKAEPASAARWSAVCMLRLIEGTRRRNARRNTLEARQPNAHRTPWLRLHADPAVLRCCTAASGPGRACCRMPEITSSWPRASADGSMESSNATTLSTCCDAARVLYRGAPSTAALRHCGVPQMLRSASPNLERRPGTRGATVFLRRVVSDSTSEPCNSLRSPNSPTQQHPACWSEVLGGQQPELNPLNR